jgi:hypothetical protein
MSLCLSALGVEGWRKVRVELLDCLVKPLVLTTPVLIRPTDLQLVFCGGQVPQGVDPVAQLGVGGERVTGGEDESSVRERLEARRPRTGATCVAPRGSGGGESKPSSQQHRAQARPCSPASPKRPAQDRIPQSAPRTWTRSSSPIGAHSSSSVSRRAAASPAASAAAARRSDARWAACSAASSARVSSRSFLSRFCWFCSTMPTGLGAGAVCAGVGGALAGASGVLCAGVRGVWCGQGQTGA